MVYLAKILTDHEAQLDGTTFSHFVKSGFTVDEAERCRGVIAGAVGRGEIDGVTVRVEIGECLPAAARRLRAFGADTGARFLVSLKLHGPSVAVARTGDRETAARAAQALVLSRCGSGARYVFDTFMDVDRGYYPRHAFIDRRFNPRPAAGVFTALASLFPGREPFAPIDDGSDEALDFMHAGMRYRLVCARRGEALASLGTLAAGRCVHDLFTGREETAADLRAAMEHGTPDGEDTLYVLLAPLG